MRTASSHASAVTNEGFTLHATELSEDDLLGGPSAGNRRALKLEIVTGGGGKITVNLSGSAASAILPVVAGAAVLIETEGDVARRYLKDHNSILSPAQRDELQRMADREPALP